MSLNVLFANEQSFHYYYDAGTSGMFALTSLMKTTYKITLNGLDMWGKFISQARTVHPGKVDGGEALI